ncbi:NB-ARC domain, LRR domain containing protein [Trema orientale]|uniref:NB-ARC domain, LRR domain containing protein n=1 Tax=Trema orientale TaxID=63057 RepID=A0A2P5FAG4_TREOI|nr:NB-ARC domain, LRR domain containing protein [Trema orientale]
MAEAAFVKVVLENLNSLIQKQFGLLWGVNKEMEKLSSTLSTIRAVLEDAEERQLKDQAIKNWLQKLSDVSLKLDDILDDCELEASRSEYQGQKRGWNQKVKSSLAHLNPMNALFRVKIAKKMKEVGDALDQIANERTKFHLREFVGERQTQVRKRYETSSIITQPHVYGREEDKERIVGFLVNEAVNSNDVSVYCIVGLGGMGKTTLAQLVYNDERVVEHFELKIWVCVSDDFDVKRLVKAILESETGSACEALELDPLQKRLQDVLRRKKFLLVLDDVWNEDQEQWDNLKYVLACGSNGSCTVVTTRLKKVATITGTVPMHQLSGLSEDDCWSLFKQRAFGSEEEELPKLVKIGKDITRKCGGVPLAAKALGGLLRFKREENEWLSVLRSELWNLPQDECSILPALRLSYFHLPVEQRRCFAYCAIFPKDHYIPKEDLIHLWMANGFISSKGELEVEEVGNEICNELYWRSLFVDIEIKASNTVGCFKMHDLVHDLAQSVMEDECRIYDVVNDSPLVLSTRVRHLYTSIEANIAPSQSLRTLMMFRKYWRKGPINLPFHSNFPSLRAYELRGLPFTYISSLSSLTHLRYLNLSSSKLRILPRSICSLQNLQTLNLRNCYKLERLPKRMTRLRRLRHLELDGCVSLSHTPPNLGQLSCLRTLSLFVVDKRKGRHLDELQGLNLGGLLKIKHLEKVESPLEAEKANLGGKHNLRSLYLSWDKNGTESSKNAEHILEALQPSPNLTLLDIHCYKGTRFPQWLSSNAMLENLVCINLSDCRNCSELPPFRRLLSLRDLDVSEMNLIQFLDNGSSPQGEGPRGFMGLKTLSVRDLPNLERLSKGEGSEVFPCLSKLRIFKCPKLTLHSIPSLKELEVFESSEVLLRSISNLYGLTSLEISSNDQMTSFPHVKLETHFTRLKFLKIFHLTKLKEFPVDLFSGLSALETLQIHYCNELECLPEELFQGSSCLRHLAITDCIKLKSLPESFRDLTALQSLDLTAELVAEAFPDGLRHFSYFKSLSMSGQHTTTKDGKSYFPAPRPSNKLVQLPEALRYLPSLEFMSISYFENLAQLPDWLGNLETLQELSFSGCPNLTYLPTSIQQLTNLRHLYINNCPKLKERCQKETGEDWHKISHIREVDAMKKLQAKSDVFTVTEEIPSTFPNMKLHMFVFGYGLRFNQVE